MEPTIFEPNLKNLSRGSNSLNSASSSIITCYLNPPKCFLQFRKIYIWVKAGTRSMLVHDLLIICRLIQSLFDIPDGNLTQSGVIFAHCTVDKVDNEIKRLMLFKTKIPRWELNYCCEYCLSWTLDFDIQYVHVYIWGSMLDPSIKVIPAELKTLEWWISGLRLNPLFFLLSRLNIAWKTHDFNLQINYSTGYLDISF